MLFSKLVFGACLVVATAAQKKKVCTLSPNSLLETKTPSDNNAVLLGDSITEITCWRPLVWNQLVSAGISNNVDFVGSMSDLDSTCTKPSTFDVNHEGHSGWQAYDIARNNIVGWVQNTKPDVVQFMLGTNDINIGKRTPQTVIDSYTTILNAVRAANPSAKVIVSLSQHRVYNSMHSYSLDLR
jgi:lysophospholipase L1-like esterase